nr:hypothetical protein [Burkholderia mallei]
MSHRRAEHERQQHERHEPDPHARQEREAAGELDERRHIGEPARQADRREKLRGAGQREHEKLLRDMREVQHAKRDAQQRGAGVIQAVRIHVRFLALKLGWNALYSNRFR